MQFNTDQQRRVLKEVGRAGSWNSPTDRCKFPTEEITAAQNFNFASKFFQNLWDLAANILHFWTKIFRQKENCPTIIRQPKIYGI